MDGPARNAMFCYHVAPFLMLLAALPYCRCLLLPCCRWCCCRWASGTSATASPQAVHPVASLPVHTAGQLHRSPAQISSHPCSPMTILPEWAATLLHRAWKRVVSSGSSRSRTQPFILPVLLARPNKHCLVRRVCNLHHLPNPAHVAATHLRPLIWPWCGCGSQGIRCNQR
ncbi:hypothetical protein K505DRAFT_84985 [Melanomma pulvis-pyrius CBS 109.77]|uniref:Secreted protein n=1 Tax=Melanomma pulvis-pyrius CBS 109.77 TaxID=1314802 RepID=A0A6A6X1M8_9PLEO|nr:hypothetical protein K505DRAFT_84985 [Melanomma pulvis-pyrius CBS 109.77]